MATRISAGTVSGTLGAVANNAYSGGLRINNTGLALAADFRLTAATFATAPTTGALVLVAVDRDNSGNAGPTPSSSMVPRYVGTFDPQPSTGNATTSWVMGIDGVSLTTDADYYVYNAATGQTLNAGASLAANLFNIG